MKIFRPDGSVLIIEGVMKFSAETTGAVKLRDDDAIVRGIITPTGVLVVSDELEVQYLPNGGYLPPIQPTQPQ